MIALWKKAITSSSFATFEGCCLLCSVETEYRRSKDGEVGEVGEVKMVDTLDREKMVDTVDREAMAIDQVWLRQELLVKFCSPRGSGEVKPRGSRTRLKETSSQASKPRNLEASKPRSLEISKPRSLEASKPQSLGASKPRSYKRKFETTTDPPSQGQIVELLAMLTCTWRRASKCNIAEIIMMVELSWKDRLSKSCAM